MRKLASLFLAIVLVMSAIAGAFASEGYFTPLKQGDRDSRTSTAVADMQVKLIELGFLDSKADGKFGPKTLAALETFQLANDLPVTGIYDEDDDNRLYAADALNAKGTTGKVKTVTTTSSTSSSSNSSGKSSSSSSRSTSSGRTSTRNTNTPDNTRNTPDNTRNTPDNTRNTPDNTRNTPDHT